MSHIVTIQTQVRDPVAIELACERLQLPPPVRGTVQMFSSEAMGWQVRLQEWRYPLVCDTDCGQLHFDNFDGRWGEPSQLDRFLQRYAVERAKLAARQQGLTAQERLLADGSIQVSILAGGAA